MRCLYLIIIFCLIENVFFFCFLLDKKRMFRQNVLIFGSDTPARSLRIELDKSKKNYSGRRGNNSNRSGENVGTREDHHRLSKPDAAAAATTKITPVFVDNHNSERQKTLDILAEQGVTNLTDQTIAKLPKWSTVEYLYGKEPRILGLDTCPVYRDRVPAHERLMSVAGTFNSGTNLLAFLLMNNCIIDEVHEVRPLSTGIKWQVPWGKHNPPFHEEFRLTHKQRAHVMDDSEKVLPAIAIRDPYTWMGSMCRESYKAKWPHVPQHCPNLVPNQVDYKLNSTLIQQKTVPVTITYGESGHVGNYSSLAHVWNEFYKLYQKGRYDRIMVRFEDLIFFPKQVTQQLCQCAGGRPMNATHFVYNVGSLKEGHVGHGDNSRTSLVEAVIKYGTGASRFHGYTGKDLEYAYQTLDRDLMEHFHYVDPAQGRRKIE